MLVYVPSKEHVYWSRIWDPTDVNNILERSVTVKLSEGDHGHFEWEPKYLSYDEFNQNHSAQEKLLTDFTRDNNIEFLNLTPTFWEQGIKRGELYHYADPHWNQAGNDLAAQTIADYPTPLTYRYPVTASTEAGPIQTVLKDFHLLPMSASYDVMAKSDEFAAIKKVVARDEAASRSAGYALRAGLCSQQRARLLVAHLGSDGRE